MIRAGMGGQAKECRGEPNTYGIPTKYYPSMRPSAFFSDERDYEDIKKLYDYQFDILETFIKTTKRTIVIPEDGIGTGLSQLDKRAPKLYHHLNNRLYRLRDIE